MLKLRALWTPALDVSGQIYAPAALPRGSGSQYPLGRIQGGLQIRFGEEKILCVSNPEDGSRKVLRNVIFYHITIRFHSAEDLD